MTTPTTDTSREAVEYNPETHADGFDAGSGEYFVFWEKHTALLAERDAALLREKSLKDSTEELRQLQREFNAVKWDRDTLRDQLAAAKDLPWRAKDIKRGLILFRTSSNAHGSINYQARSEKVDNLPQSAKDELAAIMVNMALGYSPEEVAANGVVKEWVASARNEALEEAKRVAVIPCYETRHVTLGDKVAAAIDALKSTPATTHRCAECDCENGGSDCTWISTPAPREAALADMAEFDGKHLLSDAPRDGDMTSQATPITFTYKNYRGEVAARTAVPKEIWFGTTEWHTEPGWLMTAYDLEKAADRGFALADCSFSPREVTPQEAARVLLGHHEVLGRSAVYKACENRVKIYKFDAVLRAIAQETDDE
ncbi:hypothetical protein PXK01_19470 [Phaeobacter sp. PT47_59]|uniref:hypothetical protein n=1 Tax=Phaeobacter sp. PT47_59 TaxID=3029979 RepID=UPI0023800CA8|nr:hypothetical protein [Phaeobacter sp. PT47_59]MDE4176341.1 hypothetical protein [Phaeobacter sp. PT47_59]